MFKILILVFTPVFLITPILNAQEDIKQDAEQQINDFSLAGYGDKGKKTWDITAKSADIFNDIVKLKDIIGNLYGEKEDIKLTADKGDFNKTQGNVHLEENVMITTSSGGKLTTYSLDWDRKNQVISTKDLVNIEKDNLFSTAFGATGQPDLNRVTLEKTVTVKVNPSSKAEEKQEDSQKNKIIITCDGPLEIDYEKNIAMFNNNVKVDSKDAEIYSDKMDVYFITSAKDASLSGGTPGMMGGSIEKIISRGNVKIVRGENISYSDEAIYIASDKKITLLGKPKLVIYSTEGLNASSGN
jgi:LPS export ABC transporter protein LptC